MGVAELFLVAVGLSMDAFAVAVCKGLGMKSLNKKGAVIIAAFFGSFQALMPLVGWFLGSRFQSYIVSIDHWLAFVLIGYIGGKMVYDAVNDRGREVAVPFRINIKELIMLSVATSMDALAMGLTFAFLKVNIFGAIGIIGATTFVLSLIGVCIGHRFGSVFEKKAEICGGVILILIGIKILLEHLGFVNI